MAEGEVLDAERPVLRPQEKSGRRLFVRVWYPARVVRVPRRPYVVGGDRHTLEAFAAAVGGLIPPGWVDALAGITTYSQQEADGAGGTFPTVLFSHGGFSYVSQNTPLMEHLASHGFVVWSVAHPGESGAIVYTDGDLVGYDETFHRAALALNADTRYHDKLVGDPRTRLRATGNFLDDRALGPWQRRWVDDLLAVLDAIEQGTVSGSAAPVVESCDMARVGVMGMSFGGAAAASAAHRDHRIRAAVNLDGGQFLSDLLDTDIRTPLLHLGSDLAAQLRLIGLDAKALDANEFFFEPIRTAGTRPDVHRLHALGLTHLEFTDLALIPAADRARVIPGGGQLETARIVEIINTLVLACFDHEVNGAGNGYPGAQLDRFPELSRVDLTALRAWADADGPSTR